MPKRMLINARHLEESRVAILQDDRLIDFATETATKNQNKGNIYKGIISKVERSLGAVFVDYGVDRHGFLPFSEINPDALVDSANRREGARIEDLVRARQEILVQVVKEEIGTKGAALSTYISLPGRYLVLMPGTDTGGVSRKIEDEEQRKRLRDAVAQLKPPSGFGIIVRTAGLDRNKVELQKDLQYLLRVWEEIEERYRSLAGPALVHREPELSIRILRDYFSPDVEEVLIDQKDVFQRAQDFFATFMPRSQIALKLYQGIRPLFSLYNVEHQVESIYLRKVTLSAGGSILIDPTEALVAIDVNSGKATQEKGRAETAYRVNLEAADEIARQIRLRDLGGLLVLDFIDMRDRRHMRDVERRFRNAVKDDKARVKIGRISTFGLLEMSRQRLRPHSMDQGHRVCPSCGGSRVVPTPENQALGALRRMQEAAAEGNLAEVRGRLATDGLLYLLNQKREEVLRLEKDYDVKVILEVAATPEAVGLEFIKRDLQMPAGMAERPASRPRSQPRARRALRQEPVAVVQAVEAAPPGASAETAGAALPATGEKKRRRRRRGRRRKGGVEGAEGSDEALSGVDEGGGEEGGEVPAAVGELLGEASGTDLDAADLEAGTGSITHESDPAPTDHEPPATRGSRARRPSRVRGAASESRSEADSEDGTNDDLAVVTDTGDQADAAPDTDAEAAEAKPPEEGKRRAGRSRSRSRRGRGRRGGQGSGGSDSGPTEGPGTNVQEGVSPADSEAPRAGPGNEAGSLPAGSSEPMAESAPRTRVPRAAPATPQVDLPPGAGSVETVAFPPPVPRRPLKGIVASDPAKDPPPASERPSATEPHPVAKPPPFPPAAEPRPVGKPPPFPLAAEPRPVAKPPPFPSVARPPAPPSPLAPQPPMPPPPALAKPPAAALANPPAPPPAIAKPPVPPPVAESLTPARVDKPRPSGPSVFAPPPPGGAAQPAELPFPKRPAPAPAARAPSDEGVPAERAMASPPLPPKSTDSSDES